MGWISTEEHLPENKQLVMAYTPVDGYMFVGYYIQDKGPVYDLSNWYIITAMRSTKILKKKVTHWMPLPDFPKEG